MGGGGLTTTHEFDQDADIDPRIQMINQNGTGGSLDEGSENGYENN